MPSPVARSGSATSAPDPTGHAPTAERFHQTMAREWGYGLVYLSHRHRAQALPHWLDHYNRHRPHGSLNRQTPLQRLETLNNLSGSYS
jgi:transposase InsO family protein